MHELQKHIDDVSTHLVSDAIWELLRFVMMTVIATTLVLFHRMGGKSTKLRGALWLLAVLLLVISIWVALLTHHRSGFDNGVLFAINCIASPALAVAAAYPFLREFLPLGVKRLDWARNQALWKTYSAHGGKSAVVSGPKNSIRFGVHFHQVEHKWASIEIEFQQAQDFRGYVGIVFALKTDRVYPDSTIGLQVGTSDDSRFFQASLFQSAVERLFSCSKR